MSELQRDIERIEPLIPFDPETREAWQRIKARLTPDREAVAIAICEAFTTPKGVLWWATDDETREKFRAEADAAINAMGEP